MSLRFFEWYLGVAMQDAFGNYIAGLEPGETDGSGLSIVHHGNGAPSDSTGNNGDIYVDLSTGDVYQKTGDTWTVITGGAGAAASVSSGVVDPEGVVAKATPHFYVNTANQTLWFKESGGSGTTTFWRQYI